MADIFDPSTHPQLHAMGTAFSQFYAANMGGLPMQFMPQQGAYDQMRALQQQRDVYQAMQATAQMEAESARKILRGVGTVANIGPLKDPRMLDIIQDDLAAGGPMAGLMMQNPFGRQVLRAMGGSRGSVMMAGVDITNAGANVYDPATGNLGYSGKSGGEIANQVARTLYGPGSDRSMRGVTIDEASEYMLLQRQRGDGPKSIRSVLSNDDVTNIDKMRSAGGPFDVRSVLSKNTQAQLDPAEMAALQSGTGNMDDMLRNVEAMRTSTYFKKSADLLRAFKDVFGPNSDIGQATQVMRALTQGNAQGLDDTQLAQSLQLTKELASRGGLSLEQSMALTGHLGNMADANGLSRRGIAQAVQGASAYRAAFVQEGLGANRHLDIDKMTAAHGQLQMQAGGSAVAGQMGATLNLENQMGGFKAGSEAEQLVKALRAGEMTYAGGKSVSMSSAEWRRVMLTGGADPGAIRDAQMAREYNNSLATDAGLDATVRALQFPMEIKRHLQASMAQSLGSNAMLKGAGRGAANDISSAAIDAIMELDTATYDPNAESTRQAVADAIGKTAAGAGLSESQRMQLAGQAIGNFQGTAARRYKSGHDVKALHDPKVLAATRKAEIRGKLMAGFAGEISGLGGEGVVQRIVQGLMDADETTTAGDLTKKIFNIHGSKEIQDITKKYEDRIMKEKAAVTAMLDDPNMVKDGRWTAAGQEARKEHAKQISELMKSMQTDVEAAASAEAKKPSKGQSDAQGKVGKDLASGGENGRLEIHGTLEIGGDKFPISGEAFRSPFTPIA